MLHLIFVYCIHEYIISPNSFHFGTASALLCLEDAVHYFPHNFLFLIHHLASEFPYYDNAIHTIVIFNKSVKRVEEINKKNK